MVAQRDARQVVTVIERVIANLGHSVADRRAGQVGAVVKRLALHACHAVRDRHRRQTGVDGEQRVGQCDHRQTANYSGYDNIAAAAGIAGEGDPTARDGKRVGEHHHGTPGIPRTPLRTRTLAIDRGIGVTVEDASACVVGNAALEKHPRQVGASAECRITDGVHQRS